MLVQKDRERKRDKKIGQRELQCQFKKTEIDRQIYIERKEVRETMLVQKRQREIDINYKDKERNHASSK